ncbi:MAG: hypothetical protein H0X39_20225 [Actinobacteria bacterium]|nr:hypothetical protein [Actinomycetota bacterium]
MPRKRKYKPRPNQSISVRPEIYAALRLRAKANGTTIGALITALVDRECPQ